MHGSVRGHPDRIIDNDRLKRISEGDDLVDISLCNNTWLRRAARGVTQVYDDALAPAGMRFTQYSMLQEIDRHNAAHPTIGELAVALDMDDSTVGQNLRPLMRDGLIAFANHRDRRRRPVRLTKMGIAKLAGARALWKQAQVSFESGFGVEQAELLRNLLKRVEFVLPRKCTKHEQSR